MKLRTSAAQRLLTAVAPSVSLLVAARFMTGLGIGGALPNLVALAAENTPLSRTSSAVGLLYAGLPSGGALASVTSAFVSSHWRGVFYLGGVAPLLAVPFLIWLLPESRLLRAVKHVNSNAEHSRRGFRFALFGEGRAAATLLLSIGFFLSLLAMYLLLNWLPTLLVTRGLSRADASWVQVSFNVFGALASATTGLLMDRSPLRSMVVMVFASAAVSLVVLTGVPPSLMASLAAGGLVGVTMSATQTVLYAIAPRNCPSEVRGTGIGSIVCVGRLGSAAGPLLAAALVGSGRAPQAVLATLIPIIIVAGAAVTLLASRMSRSFAETARSSGAAP